MSGGADRGGETSKPSVFVAINRIFSVMFVTTKSGKPNMIFS